MAAIEAADRPDVVLQLAFDAAHDRKAVIRYAANIIPLVKNEGFVSRLVTPYPDAREAVDVYADNVTRVSVASANGRATFLGTLLAFVLALAIQQSSLFGGHVFVLPFFVLVPVLIALLRVAYAGIVRRRAAQLDDESAFAIVLGHVARAVDKDPSRVPVAMMFLQRNLVKLFERRPQ